jgi:hypothetical protein
LKGESKMRFLDKLFELFGEQQSTGPNWRERADLSDLRARVSRIDPPRPGRKTYAERYAETNELSDSQIDARIAAREAAGKECGVLYRVKANRGH